MILTTLDYLYALGAVSALIIPSIDLIRTRKVKKVWYKRITCIGWLIIILAVYLGYVSIYGASVSNQKIIDDSTNRVSDRNQIIHSIEEGFKKQGHSVIIDYNPVTNEYLIVPKNVDTSFFSNQHPAIPSNPILGQRHFTDKDLRKMLKGIPKTVTNITIERIGDERESFIYANEMKDKLTKSGYKNINIQTAPLSADFENIYDKFIQWPTNVSIDTVGWGILIYPASLSQTPISNISTSDQKLNQSFDDLSDLDHTKSDIAITYIRNNFPDTISNEQAKKLFNYMSMFGTNDEELLDLISYQKKSAYLDKLFKLVISKNQQDPSGWRYFLKQDVNTVYPYVVSIIKDKQNPILKYTNITTDAILNDNKQIAIKLLNSKDLINSLITDSTDKQDLHAMYYSLNSIFKIKPSYIIYKDTYFFKNVKDVQ